MNELLLSAALLLVVSFMSCKNEPCYQCQKVCYNCIFSNENLCISDYGDSLGLYNTALLSMSKADAKE